MAKDKQLYIIYTGGTIGMKKSSQGYIPQPNLLTELMHTMSEFDHDEMPNYTVHEYTPLIDSANMDYSDWQAIATDLYQHYDDYDGFIVLHGTDTMAYTASALSFMLAGFNKPIILTGSQVPLIEVHTDARENLIMSMLIAATYQIPEVCIYFNNLLLRGNRAQKVNTFSFNAFASPNFPVLAHVGVNINVRHDLILKKSNQNLTLLSINRLSPPRINQFTLTPGLDISQLANFLVTQPHALILHTYGVGNAPINNKKLMKNFEHLINNGTLIINHTQCHQGGIQMGSYATSQILKDMGIISAYDMTIEAIIAKLSVLLSQKNTTELISQLSTSIAGEVTLVNAN